MGRKQVIDNIPGWNGTGGHEKLFAIPLAGDNNGVVIMGYVIIIPFPKQIQIGKGKFRNPIGGHIQPGI
jgi:hypothetical protein